MAVNTSTDDDGAAPEVLFTEQQTADLSFGGSLYLLRRARTDGSGPPWVRIGRKYFYPPQGVAEHQRALQQFLFKGGILQREPHSRRIRGARPRRHDACPRQALGQVAIEAALAPRRQSSDRADLSRPRISRNPGRGWAALPSDRLDGPDVTVRCHLSLPLPPRNAMRNRTFRSGPRAV